MRVNLPLRKLYYTLLNTVGVPVYYMEEPDNCTDDAYIVFHSPNSSDDSTFSTFDTTTSIQIDIHTEAVKGIASTRLDEIADAVLSVIKPAPNQHIEGDGVQITSTRITNDRVEPPLMLGGSKFATRRIVVEHGVFVNFNPS